MTKKLLLIFAWMIAGSCCRLLDCIGYDYHIRLTVLDAVTHEPVFHGPDKKYDPDSLYGYFLDDHTPLHIELGPLDTGLGTDTALYIDIWDPRKFVLLYPRGIFRDTFEINYSNADNKCCGDGQIFESLEHNGMLAEEDPYTSIHFTIYK